MAAAAAAPPSPTSLPPREGSTQGRRRSLGRSPSSSPGLRHPSRPRAPRTRTARSRRTRQHSTRRRRPPRRSSSLALPLLLRSRPRLASCASPLRSGLSTPAGATSRSQNWRRRRPGLPRRCERATAAAAAATTPLSSSAPSRSREEEEEEEGEGSGACSSDGTIRAESLRSSSGPLAVAGELPLRLRPLRLPRPLSRLLLLLQPRLRFPLPLLPLLPLLLLLLLPLPPPPPHLLLLPPLRRGPYGRRWCSNGRSRSRRLQPHLPPPPPLLLLPLPRPSPGATSGEEAGLPPLLSRLLLLRRHRASPQ